MDVHNKEIRSYNMSRIKGKKQNQRKSSQNTCLRMDSVTGEM